MKKFIIVLLMLVCALGVVACGKTEHEAGAEAGHGAEGEEHAAEGPAAVTLKAEQILTGGIEIAVLTSDTGTLLLSAPGELEGNPDRMAQLGSSVPGRITMARRQVGERVARGELLAQVVAVEQSAAEAEAPATDARLELARENLARERSLYERGLSPRRDLSAAEAALRQAEAERVVVGRRVAALASSITAPLAGVIAERKAMVGQVVEAGQTLYTIVDPSRLLLRIEIPANHMSHVPIGVKVRVVTDAYADRVFTGQVRSVAPVVDEATRTVRVLVDVDNADGALRPGLFVTAQIEEDEGAARQTIIVPESAIGRLEGKPVIFVASDSGAAGIRFEARVVEPGATFAQGREIRSGLLGNELIVVKGEFILRAELAKGSIVDPCASGDAGGGEESEQPAHGADDGHGH